MKAPKLRLLIAGLFFFGWVGWLTYLAFNKTNPVIISRSQIMVATHFVLAEVEVDPETKKPTRVMIVEDLKPIDGKPLAGKMDIANLHEARIGGASDFSVSGKYLLPLNRVTVTDKEKRAYLASPPATPRDDSPFPPLASRPWAYRWEAPGVEAQFRSLRP